MCSCVSTRLLQNIHLLSLGGISFQHIRLCEENTPLHGPTAKLLHSEHSSNVGRYQFVGWPSQIS
jgi:hypothetical protein